MPSTSATPGPEGPRPLSEREQRELAEVERSLTASAPGLATRFRRGLPSRQGPLDHVLQGVAVAVVLVLVLPTEWLAGLTVLAVLSLATAAGLMLGPRDGGRGS